VPVLIFKFFSYQYQKLIAIYQLHSFEFKPPLGLCQRIFLPLSRRRRQIFNAGSYVEPVRRLNHEDIVGLDLADAVDGFNQLNSR